MRSGGSDAASKAEGDLSTESQSLRHLKSLMRAVRQGSSLYHDDYVRLF